MRAEDADKLYECVGYDVATDSCEGIVIWTIDGNVATSQAFVAAIQDEETINISTVTRHSIVNGRICGLKGDLEVAINGETFARGENFMADFMGGFLTAAMSETCSSYYRSGEGYYVETTKSDGQVIEELSSATRFFDERKPLRATPM